MKPTEVTEPFAGWNTIIMIERKTDSNFPFKLTFENGEQNCNQYNIHVITKNTLHIFYFLYDF